MHNIQMYSRQEGHKGTKRRLAVKKEAEREKERQYMSISKAPSSFSLFSHIRCLPPSSIYVVLKPLFLPTGKENQPTYGTADWAAGYTDGEPAEEIQETLEEGTTGGQAQQPPVSIPDQSTSSSKTGSDDDAAAADTYTDTDADEEWMTVQKGAFFIVLVGAVAVYLRMSRRRNFRENVGYEKTLA
ncbi:hypothetical protein BD289DRAFT_237370 [Coniella lustricola]|uniref:Uncharacterized protein n=1 Tax=Coniella lustricola TaxID=2025994 RepID=A0A2T3AL11_9PEZI|nr:hypothetical protein BD289DRAFT_237370 [Coniella lustricola]